MSGLGLQVRCLASTRFHEGVRNEQELGEAEDRNTDQRGSEDDTLDEGVDDDSKSSRGEDFTTSEFEQDDVNNKRNSTSRLPSLSPSQSSSGSTSSSDDDTTSSTSNASTNKPPSTPYISCVQESLLSPDGSCILTSDYSRSLTIYPIPSTIFNPPHPKPLHPYAKLTSPDPIWSFAATPLFNISDPSTTHVLLSRRDRYITLHNALWNPNTTGTESATQGDVHGPVDISTPIASYKLISPLTEALTAPSSLAYSLTGTHFFAGLRNTIALFDLSHQSSPIQRIPTIPSARNILKGGGVGYKGVVSALSLSPSSRFHRTGILAAGTRTRCVGLYDAESAEEISSFRLPGDDDNLAGGGVTALKWSPCGMYLYIAERRSNVLLIHDVRRFSTCLAYCKGRQADTNQKLGFDVWSAGAGGVVEDAYGYAGDTISHEIWAGGTDGCVRVWRDPWAKEGGVQADEVVKVGDGGMPVVGTMVHGSGGLAGVACGWVDVGSGDEGEGEGGESRGAGKLSRVKDGGSLDILGLS